VAVLLSAWSTRKRLAAPAQLTTTAALAALSGFALAAALDWVWELPVIAVAAMLLAAVAFCAGRPPLEPDRAPNGRGWIMGALALIPIALLTLVLAGASALEQSRADARAGKVDSALGRALEAHAVNGSGATPLIQSALLREERGDIVTAVADARAAARREPMNWRTWLVLSRLEARSGRAQASVRAYRRARTLNPNHPLFR
jgi:cytochrome c-type biogenesis protein CcmH/NrfG